MNFNGEELMLMMLYNSGTRLGLMQELRLMVMHCFFRLCIRGTATGILKSVNNSIG